ncbi:MAG: InlB B-repeat-containing protein, partial [Myxococcales bacterium]
MRSARGRFVAGPLLLAIACGGNTPPLAKGPGNHTLSVKVDGSGMVRGDVQECRSTCDSTLASGARAHLEATADAGWAFSGWSGSCTGSGSCEVVLDADVTVMAVFARVPPPPPQRPQLVVGITGSGSVRSSPVGIDCRPNCTAAFDRGTVVTLTATPAAGLQFDGWGAACAGKAACKLTLGGDAQVFATFSAPPVRIEVSFAGSGSGRVTASPALLDCSGTCTATIPNGTTLALTATPQFGSRFAGWSRGCSGGGACTVSATDKDIQVRATFELLPTHRVDLAIGFNGSSSGRVVSDPPGIDCTSNCSATFPEGAQVALTATPDSRSTFLSWFQGCGGTDPVCKVVVLGDMTVQANWEAAAPEAAVWWFNSTSAVALNGTYAFYASTQIGRGVCNVYSVSKASGAQVLLAQTVGRCGSMAADEQRVYWTSATAGSEGPWTESLYAFPLDGSGAQVLARGPRMGQIAAGADGVYFATVRTTDIWGSSAIDGSGAVYRVSPGRAPEVLATGVTPASGLAIDATSVYFGSRASRQGQLLRVPRAGGSVAALFSSGGNVWPTRLAVDATNAYFRTAAPDVWSYAKASGTASLI